MPNDQDEATIQPLLTNEYHDLIEYEVITPEEADSIREEESKIIFQVIIKSFLIA